MYFGREVYDEFFTVKQVGIPNGKQFARLQLVVFTSPNILLIVMRKCFLKLQSNALTHYTHSVNGIYQRLCIGFQQVAC